MPHFLKATFLVAGGLLTVSETATAQVRPLVRSTAVTQPRVAPTTPAPARTATVAPTVSTRFSPPATAPDRPKVMLIAPLPNAQPQIRVQRHHVIPQELKTHPAVQQATAGGFRMNSFYQNGLRLPAMREAELKQLRATGVGQGRDGRAMDAFLKRSNHLGPHPEYTRGIGTRLDALAARGGAEKWSPDKYRIEIKALVRDARAGLRSGSTALTRTPRP